MKINCSYLLYFVCNISRNNLSKSQKYLRKMSVRLLSPSLAEKAKIEVSEDPKRTSSALEHIKDWLGKQKHLKARTDDQWLLNFLRGCKFSLEKTKEKLDLYYSVRSTAPEFFNVKHDSKKFDEILSTGSFLVLPKLAKPDDPITVIMRPRYNTDKYKFVEMMAANLIITKIMFLENDNLAVSGVRYIFDMKGATSYFLQLTPVIIKKAVVITQDANPIRMRKSHFLNTPPTFETLFNVIKGFLNEKAKQKLNMHKTIESIYEHIPLEILPAEYGGEGGTEEEIIEYWRKKVQEYRSWLDEDEKYGTDESKRPGKPKTAETMFGLEGSFRQLEFD